MKYDKWNFLSGSEAAAEGLEAAAIPPLAARVLAARGYDTPEKAAAFLKTNTSLLYDPFQLKDMDRATARLEQGIVSRETTATTMWTASPQPACSPPI